MGCAYVRLCVYRSCPSTTFHKPGAGHKHKKTDRKCKTRSESASGVTRVRSQMIKPRPNVCFVLPITRFFLLPCRCRLSGQTQTGRIPQAVRQTENYPYRKLHCVKRTSNSARANRKSENAADHEQTNYISQTVIVMIHAHGAGRHV